MEKNPDNRLEPTVTGNQVSSGQQVLKRDAQHNVRLSMTGQVYADGKKLSVADRLDQQKTSHETASIDRLVDEENPPAETEDKARSISSDPPSRQLPVNNEKKDPPPARDKPRDDNGLGKASYKEQAIRTKNGGLKSPVRRSRKRKGSSLLDGVDIDDQLVGENYFDDSNSVAKKGDRKTCIIFVLSILVILAYGGGVYTGVVISTGRDSSMFKITPDPTPAPTPAPTRKPSVENDAIP